MRAVAIAALLCAAPASAQNTDARNLAAACAICHGTDGKAAPGAPVAALAGMPREQIAAQMRAFRNGQRPATVMHQLAKGYTDPEIDALASWFASQKK